MLRHPTTLQVITTRALEGGLKEHRAKYNWPRETHSVTYAPGLSTLSYLSSIVGQARQSFFCSPWPPSHHPFSLTSVYLVPALHLLSPSTPFCHTVLIHSFHMLKPSQYSLIRSTCQLHFYSSSHTHLFIPKSIHSCHSNQTYQQLHLKNIHFPYLIIFHTPCLWGRG